MTKTVYLLGLRTLDPSRAVQAHKITPLFVYGTHEEAMQGIVNALEYAFPYNELSVTVVDVPNHEGVSYTIKPITMYCEDDDAPIPHTVHLVTARVREQWRGEHMEHLTTLSVYADLQHAITKVKAQLPMSYVTHEGNTVAIALDNNAHVISPINYLST